MPGFGGSAAARTSPRGPLRSRPTACARARAARRRLVGRLALLRPRPRDRAPARRWRRDDLGLPPLALGRYEAWLEFDHARRTVHGPRRRRRRAPAACAARSPQRPSPLHEPLDRLGQLAPAARLRAGGAARDRLHPRRRRLPGQPLAAPQRRVGRRSVRPLRAPARDEPGAVHGARAARRRGRDLGLAGAVPEPPRRARSRRGRSRARARAATDRAEDRRQALALRSSAKDRAENVMIVDLARNDLGRVAALRHRRGRASCARSSPIPGVHHLVSTVEARLRAGVSAADIVRATFPPGSVTGARRSARWRSSRSSSRCAAGPTAARSAGSARRRPRAVGRDPDVRGRARAPAPARRRRGRGRLRPGARVARDDAQGGAPAARRPAASVRRAASRSRSPREGLARTARSSTRRRRACPPSDHGFLLGDGVFETLRWLRRRAVRARRASRRGCERERAALGIAPPAATELERAAHAVLRGERARATRACGSRVTSGAGPPGLARGDGAADRAGRRAAARAVAARPSTAIVSRLRRDEHSPLAGVKTISLAESVMALAEARGAGADEALLLNTARRTCARRRPRTCSWCATGACETPPLDVGLPGRDHARARACALRMRRRGARRYPPADAAARPTRCS